MAVKMISFRKMQAFAAFVMLIFVMGTAASQDRALTPNQELETIIELFLTEQGEAAFTQLQSRETALNEDLARTNDLDGYVLLGRAYFYSEQDAKALKAFDKALQGDTSKAEAHFFTGLIHGYANELDKAKTAFQAAIKAEADNGTYYLELGRILEKMGDMAAAVNAYEKVVSLDNDDFDAHFSLAVIYAEQNDFKRAEKHFQGATNSNPEDLDAQYNLGQLYQTHKKPRKAIKQFEKVLKINPNEWQAIAKLVQENAAINDVKARDVAVERIYDVWRSQARQDLVDQKFYIREQIDFGDDRIFVLEYFEMQGERPRKYVFKQQDQTTKELKFDISLGSYDSTTEYARAKGAIGPDERRYHLDGYAPDGSHYTYGIFSPIPKYDWVKDMALKAFSGELEVLSSSKVMKGAE